MQYSNDFLYRRKNLIRASCNILMPCSPMVERQTVNLYVVGSIPIGAVRDEVIPSSKVY